MAEETMNNEQAQPNLDLGLKADADKLAKIEKAIARLDAANREFALNRAKAEEARINRVLEGVGEGGVPPPAKKEESPQEYAARIMAGEQ